MFDTVRNNKRIVQGFLVLITLPFALWGVESYISSEASDPVVATVGKTKIGQQAFQQALREQGERMQQQLRERFDPKMLESSEARLAVVNGLVNQQLLNQVASEAHVYLSDEALARFIAQVPALQEDGKFSPDRYQALVASRGMSKEAFEARLRQDLAMQQLLQPVGDAALVAKAASARWSVAQLEQRVVAEFRLAPEAYVKDAKLEADAAQKFYDSNPAQFEVPEQIKVEYVVLDQEQLAQQVSIADADVEARYKAHPERYTQPESRRASHILLTLTKDAAEADVTSAQAKAQNILAEIKKDPKQFAALAKKYSQDSGSAGKGGDLDWFARGMMVKPFEDAVFSLKQDEVSELVRSDFGLHIIRLTGIKPEKVTPLAEVRGEIVAELRREAATRKFAEAAEAFNNQVYEQPDTLQPVAEQWKLAIQQTDWLRKGDKLARPFDSPKLQEAIFAADAISKKQNTEAVEIAPGKLLAARVVDHRPATLQAFDAVKSLIVQQLTRTRAMELAQADGSSRLAKLSGGEAVDVRWGAARKVLRAAPQGLPREAAQAIFAADAGKLPTYVGAKADDGGYTLYKLSEVVPAAADDPRATILAQQYARLIAEEEFAAWMAVLRRQNPVNVKEDRLLAAKE